MYALTFRQFLHAFDTSKEYYACINYVVCVECNTAKKAAFYNLL